METKYSSKASLFLMELIIAILFFAISSAICTQLFVKSHIISQHTVNDNHAVLWVQNISEVFYSKNGDFESCKTFFKEDEAASDYAFLTPLLSAYEDSMYFIFDRDWNLVQDSASADYIVLALYSSDDLYHYLNLCTFQLPTHSLTSDTASAKEYESIDSLSQMLEQQQIWNYFLQIKSYSGLKGERYE